MKLLISLNNKYILVCFILCLQSSSRGVMTWGTWFSNLIKFIIKRVCGKFFCGLIICVFKWSIWMILIMKPQGGYIYSYTRICMYDHDYVMHFYLMVMLRSSTCPYGQPVIEVAYGEIWFHSTEAVWEIIAREEWLGCRHDASPMFDIPGSTPV